MLHTFLNKVIKPRILAKSYVENYGGLVMPVQREQNGKIQTFPVTEDVSSQECWDNSLYLMLSPDTSKKSVLWFEDVSGLQKADAPPQPNIKNKNQFAFKNTFRLVFWANREKLQNSGRYMDILALDLIKEVTEAVAQSELDGDDILEKTWLEVNIIRKRKDASVFRKYSFDESKTPYTMYPFDFFDIEFEFFFALPKACVIVPDIDDPDCENPLRVVDVEVIGDDFEEVIGDDFEDVIGTFGTD